MLNSLVDNEYPQKNVGIGKNASKISKLHVQTSTYARAISITCKTSKFIFLFPNQLSYFIVTIRL